MQKPILPNPNRLFCPISDPHYNLFFSLVDYKNNYFTSNDPNKIIEFYDGFEDRDQLTNWMKERPTGVTNIFEVEGSNEIIVVIPTADFNGKYAKDCRENIFKGLHIIYVESGGREDFYFNFAHNCNVGIKKAMEYNPKWVVYSNDDMYKIDDINVLKKTLQNIDNKKISTVFTNAASYHSIPVKLAKPRTLLLIYMKMRNRATRIRSYLWKRLDVKYFLPIRGLFGDILYTKGLKCYSIASFGIFSSEFVKEFTFENGEMFDETFVNATEDIDLSLKMTLCRTDYEFINYNIGNHINGTLGASFCKQLRDIAGDALLNYLISNGNDRYHEEIRKMLIQKR